MSININNHMYDSLQIDVLSNSRMSKSYTDTVRRTFLDMIEWAFADDDLFSGTNNTKDFSILFQNKLDELPFKITLIETDKTYLKWEYFNDWSLRTYVTFDYRRHWRRKQLIEILG